MSDGTNSEIIHTYLPGGADAGKHVLICALRW